MAKYKCDRFKELTFYCNGKPRKFKNGVYSTTDKDEIALLSKLTGIKAVSVTKGSGDTK